MSTALDALGNRYVVCSGCGAEGPHRAGDRHAREAAKSAGWARSYPRGRGEDFFCPTCRSRPTEHVGSPGGNEHG